MNLVKATVVKRDSEDGVSFLRDEVPIGFEYLVDLDSIRVMDWLDATTGQHTLRPSATIYGSATNLGSEIGAMPLELLRIEESRGV